MSQANVVQQQGVVLRIPGPWRRRQELEARLEDGFRVQCDSLVAPSGRTFALEMIPADQEFPRIFSIACRRPMDVAVQRRLESYAMIAAIIGPSGSMEAARQMLEAGAGIVRAGGVGVFIDNSLAAHSGSDWLELAENSEDPAAVFYTFVTIAKIGSHIRSHGMHVLGKKDAMANRLHVLSSLEDFLRMTTADEIEPQEGKTFFDRSGSHFRLHSESNRAIYPNHPVNNPYGLWRLEPIPSS